MWERLQQHLLKRSELHVDETTMPCLAENQTRKMRMWTHLSSAGEVAPMILYDFTSTKAGEHVRQFLKGWSGYLHADAASNYDELYRQNPNIQEVAVRFAHLATLGRTHAASSTKLLSTHQLAYWRMRPSSRSMRCSQSSGKHAKTN